MLLELRKLMTSPGETLPFETSVDLSDMPFGGCKPVRTVQLANQLHAALTAAEKTALNVSRT